jgi:hypothetical protein
LFHLEPRLKPVKNRRLVVRTGDHGDRTIMDLDQRLVGIMWCQATAWTPNAAGRAMVQQIGRIVRRQITDPGELLDMIVAPEERDGERIDKEERRGLPASCVQGSLAVFTRDRRLR